MNKNQLILEIHESLEFFLAIAEKKLNTVIQVPTVRTDMVGSSAGYAYFRTKKD